MVNEPAYTGSVALFREACTSQNTNGISYWARPALFVIDVISDYLSAIHAQCKISINKINASGL